MLTERPVILHLILDPSLYRKDIGSKYRGLPNVFNEMDANEIEKMGRTFCYQLYRRRFQILSEENEEEDSDTDIDQDNYSLHDTTDTSSSDSDYDWDSFYSDMEH